MLYSQEDINSARSQLIRRIAGMAVLAIVPNAIAAVIMFTARIQWLSIALGCLGGALAIFYWGLYCYPVSAYLRFVREVVEGRRHEFHGVLLRVAEDSVREGVPCKTLYFHDDAGDDEKLCYFDRNKLPKDGFQEGARYAVSVHGQSIVSMQLE
ncbi:MAG: hypothetical protein ACOX83_11705 [Candidatus Spyradocola sp.]|jgi:hypothetical protein